MEIYLRISIYIFLLLCFFLLPGLVYIIHKLLLKRFLKINISRVTLILIICQILLIAGIFIQPIITFSHKINREDIEKSSSWANDTLKKGYSGIYSSNIPILAYRFHITGLGYETVEAEVMYFPFGKIKVQWDGLYNIIEPLSGL